MPSAPMRERAGRSQRWESSATFRATSSNGASSDAAESAVPMATRRGAGPHSIARLAEPGACIRTEGGRGAR